MLDLPQKSNFKLDEVCEITGVKPYILRFWESEFPEIEPITTSSGQKIYEHKDIELVKRIKKLMFEEKLSLEKAKATLLNPESFADDVEVEVFSDSQIQKLVLAKARLQTIISKIQGLKTRYDFL